MRAVALLVTLAFLPVCVACQPREIDVTTTADGERGSLRAAISAANAQPAGDVRIELPAGTYELTRCGSDDNNASGDLDVAGRVRVTIEAAEPDVVIRQTCEGERVLDAHGGGRLTLIGVTVTGGSVSSANPAQAAEGGGVRVQGDLELERVTITENEVMGAPGQVAIAGATPVASGAAYGGGLFVAGSLSASSSNITMNVATGGYGPDAPNADGVGNSGGLAEGGGAYVVGGITITGGTLSENRAVGGDGSFSVGTSGGGGAARGGGIAQRALSTRPVQISKLVLSANRAQGGMSGTGTLYNPPGPPAGDALGGGLASSGPLVVRELKASQNTAAGGWAPIRDCGGSQSCSTMATGGHGVGGAIATKSTTSVESSAFTGNESTGGNAYLECFDSFCGSRFGAPAGSGRGGALWAGAELVLSTTQFVENRAAPGWGFGVEGVTRGGALASDSDVRVSGGEFTGNTAQEGGGGAISAALVSLTDVTLSNNSSGLQGGAVDAQTLTGQAVTASHNTAGGRGGALAVAADATIERSTIVDNAGTTTADSTTPAGGGIYVAGHLTLRHSSVSRNSGLGVGFTGGGARAGSITAEAVSFVANEIEVYVPPFPLPPGTEVRAGGAAVAASGRVQLTNATLSDNEIVITGALPGDNFGAAVFAPTLVLEHATIADNRGSPSLLVTELTTRSSVIAADTGHTACGEETPVATGSYNHVSDTSCALAGNDNQQSEAEFLLGPAADNGGPVPTRRPANASLLIDRVPASACPIRVDARGVSRPQGPACDIGAVEAEPLAGDGAADLAVAFTNPPMSATPGAEATWQLTVTNKGPHSKAPAVRIHLPEGLSLTAATATGGASCTTSDPVLCVWHQVIPTGNSATVTWTGRIDPALTEPLAFDAGVIARDLTPPLDDDAAQLSTPLAPRSGLQMSAKFTRYSTASGRQFTAMAVELRNAGPSAAIGTTAQPIEVVWNTAPGVRVIPTSEDALNVEETIYPPAPLLGTFPPSEQPLARFHITFAIDGPPPAQLGTLELRPGANVQAPAPPIPVLQANVEVRTFRAAGAQEPGAATPVRFEVINP